METVLLVASLIVGILILAVIFVRKHYKNLKDIPDETENLLSPPEPLSKEEVKFIKDYYKEMDSRKL